MIYLNTEARAKYLIDTVHQNSRGFLLTLVGLTNSKEKFEEQLLTFSTWMNDYCLGRVFTKQQDRLEIFGSVERGEWGNRLHAHLIIRDHEKVKRSDQELNAFVRKKWIKLIQANASVMSSLVDFQRARHLKSATIYALKEVRSRDSSNLLYI